MYNETMLAGILISMLYMEMTGLSAGLIIPGYLALSLHSPFRLVMTLSVALAAVGVCRLLSRVIIIYGRRRFAMLILLTFLIGEIIRLTGFIPGNISLIGILVPGILAREIDKQGIADTLVSVVITTGILAGGLILTGYPVFG